MENSIKRKKGSNNRNKGNPKDKLKKNETNNLENNNYLVTALKKTVEKEKDVFVKKIEADIDELTDQIVNAMESKRELWWDSSGELEQSMREKDCSNSKKSSTQAFHDKSFKARNSLLTDLFKVNHISTIYHIFIAFLINLIVTTALHDVIKLGKINLGFKLIYWNFQSLPLAIVIWLAMQTTTIGLYFFFKAWACKRAHLSYGTLKLWDFSCLIFVIFYQIIFLLLPAYVILHQRPAIAVSLALLMEQVRFEMKTYSFMRTIAPKIMNLKNRKAATMIFPTLEKYTYFLFAPTLVYRDEYPRTSRIRWRVVIRHFIEIVGVIFYLAFIMEKYLIPSARNFGKTQMTTEELLVIFFNNNVPCVFVFLCGFYCFLHSWLNAFAELLRFADRMFYQDWWNSSSFAEYYKTWNVVVHDWLYTYVYKDATVNLTKRKGRSTWLVFIISALFHEYILAFTFKFCYPVLFIVFGIIGTCLVFIPKRHSSAIGNMLLWLCIFIGTGCCGSLYMLEYYARINCPRIEVSPIRDFFTPRSWTCQSISSF